MDTIQEAFAISRKEHKGDKIDILIPKNFTDRLRKELPENFTKWLNPRLTGSAIVDPIAEVNIEFDSHGYLYCALISKSGNCVVSTGSAPNLYDWGIVSRQESDYAFEKRQNVVAQFLALCFREVLPEACKSPEFLALPREEKIVFNIGAHSGWSFDKLFIYEGEHHEIDYGNRTARRLHVGANCSTKADTPEREFIDNIQTIDVRKCADELIPIFTNFLNWIAKEDIVPLEFIMIAWWSDFEKTAFAGGTEEEFYQWDGEFLIGEWFGGELPKDLNERTLEKICNAVTSKLAEISCIAVEDIEKLDVFKNIPKVSEGFVMEALNESEGGDTEFYPIETKESI